MTQRSTVYVKDLMTSDVTVVRQDADLLELQRMFIEHQIHGVPVVDASGRLVGVVSQTDVVNWHHEIGIDGSTFYMDPEIRLAEQDDLGRLRIADIRTARVDEVMTGITHVVTPDDEAAYAAARMMELGVHRLVVVDSERSVLGVLSASDLLALVPGVERYS